MMISLVIKTSEFSKIIQNKTEIFYLFLKF